MTPTMASQNIHLSSWDTLYVHGSDITFEVIISVSNMCTRGASQFMHGPPNNNTKSVFCFISYLSKVAKVREDR
jgi:hypothetical protein